MVGGGGENFENLFTKIRNPVKVLPFLRDKEFGSIVEYSYRRSLKSSWNVDSFEFRLKLFS